MLISSCQFSAPRSPRELDYCRKTKVAIQAHIILVFIDVKSLSVGFACLTDANYSMQRYGMPPLGPSCVSQQRV